MDVSDNLEQNAKTFLDDLAWGMRQPQKQIPCKYFYDRQGCELFEQICELDEYYLTRTELGIMQRHAGEMADAIGPRCLLVELGSGAGVKTRILLDQLDSPAAYVPVDLACDHLQQATSQLARDYRNLKIVSVRADFTDTFEIPPIDVDAQRTVIYFPGSTIGNLDEVQTIALLERMIRLCGPGGGMLIGLDLQKDAKVITAAYNDAKGVTAEFNLNILRHANRATGANFAVDQFRHDARYDPSTGRIEMHLESTCDQIVSIGGNEFSFQLGETILTEYSHKYNLDRFAQIADRAGFQVVHTWSDERKFFAVVYLRVV